MNVTLTFDNGPEPAVTPAVLNTLARHEVRAAFFVLGEKLVQHEPIARRALSEGHSIGSHTWSHWSPLGRLSETVALDEFDRGAAAVESLGVKQHLFRPIGSGVIGRHLLQPAVIDRLKSGGYTCVLWNCVPGDWRDPHHWLDRALRDVRTRPWSLVVLHDLPNGAMDHLDEFLTRLTDEGHSFTTEFPPDCVPILNGEVVLPLDPIVTGTPNP